MSKKSRWVTLGIICVLSFALIFSSPALADEVTISGKINDQYQIVTKNSTVYEVADTDMGNDLLNNVGKNVKVTGRVVVEEGKKIIFVTFYEVIETS